MSHYTKISVYIIILRPIQELVTKAPYIHIYIYTRKLLIYIYTQLEICEHMYTHFRACSRINLTLILSIYQSFYLNVIYFLYMSLCLSICLPIFLSTQTHTHKYTCI